MKYILIVILYLNGHQPIPLSKDMESLDACLAQVKERLTSPVKLPDGGAIQAGCVVVFPEGDPA